MNASQTATRTVTGTCTRCDGTGNIRAFSHYANGTCFGCDGTGVATVEIREADAGDAELREAHRAVTVRRKAWLASIASMAPAQVVARFRALPEDKLWAVRNECAGWEVPGARLAYWSASTVLGAWPGSRPYPVSWI